MNFWDWIGLGMMLTTLLGAELEPQDYNAQMVRTTPGQVESQRSPSVAGVAVGGRLLFQFADSGLTMAEERAIDARESLNRAIFHYDITNRYLPIGLRQVGGNDMIELYYFDLRLMTVTAADAKAAGVASTQKLADGWKGELDKAFRTLPKSKPDGWIAVTGSVAGATMISDATLVGTASEVIGYAPGQAVRLSAKGGVLTVEGHVQTDAQRRKVLRTLKRLPGVRGIDDKLEVRQAGLPLKPIR